MLNAGMSRTQDSDISAFQHFSIRCSRP